MQDVVWSIVAALLTSCLTGCAPSADAGPPLGASADAAGDEVARWPFWPRNMRLHPLTRLATDASGQTVIEARIEFFDREEDTTKGYGQVRIDLYGVNDAAGSEPRATWNRDLRVSEFNRENFDVVTRTYLLRLELDPADLPAKPELRAFFLSADGHQMEADLRLRMK